LSDEEELNNGTLFLDFLEDEVLQSGADLPDEDEQVDEVDDLAVCPLCRCRGSWIRGSNVGLVGYSMLSLHRSL